ATTDPLSKASEQFRILGITIQKNKDGTVDMDATMKLAMAAMARIPDAALRANIAMELMGKGGKELAAKMGDLSDAQQLAARQTQLYGAVNEEAAKAGEMMEVQTTLMGDAM